MASVNNRDISLDLLLGDWCRRQRNNSKLCVIFVVIATILLILSVGISLYISKLRNETFLSLGHYFSPITVFVSVGLYFACNMLSIKLTGLDKLQKYLRNISVCTLGIYLIHMFLLIQGYTRVVRFVSNPLIFLPLVGWGWLITFVIRKIPYIGKYIV